MPQTLVTYLMLTIIKYTIPTPISVVSVVLIIMLTRHYSQECFYLQCCATKGNKVWQMFAMLLVLIPTVRS